MQKTSLRNVKERLDFSCALFTREGKLVVNAPHIPVHLGAMGETVRHLLADIDVMHPGDVFVTNDPYRGGSHLPDVTVVTPVFDPGGKELLFFTGSRAHHAEIGGIVPGSMPPFSKSLAEEGVLIRAFRLVHGERSSEDALRRLLTQGPFPSRSVEENIADINAAVAANQTGAQRLHELVDRYGLETIRAYMGHIQRAAERKMRFALLKFPEGRYAFKDQLDNQAVIAVTITIRHRPWAGEKAGEAIVDFSGTGPVTPDNLNANSAIVRAAVLYCFRCLIDEDIPLNDGVLAPVTIVVPDDCLLNPPSHDDPSDCAAVGGGNVETSQRIVDVVFGALGVVAASQGTMNNFLFGRPTAPNSPGFGYYETIGGGAGAGPGFPGASAVHTHMTNTRITDAEVMEARYPVRVREFSIRAGTGGQGKFSGGNGIVREIEFLAPVEISLITNRRSSAPYGVAGGHPGTRGKNLLRAAGSEEWMELKSSEQRSLSAGDILRIETPGGGGFGLPKEQ
ncbi:MAG: hydantoinase B/oxoprolinase family protein [Planctomycetota bacterium]